MTRTPFDPEMNGGLQLDLFGQGAAVSVEQLATNPAVADPPTVVCLNDPEGEPCPARVLAELADAEVTP
ncbi:hypothetical protein [Streptomyces sp. Wb2n-11]|uniref:hypothetical protein n=1 Tax=Streptomyces sp. Wb2n-11 TaxID=1030533 RepID=UPI000A825EF5|nr:hypothetical protein [Streptomyces sp. Wb2n-11]